MLYRLVLIALSATLALCAACGSRGPLSAATDDDPDGGVGLDGSRPDSGPACPGTLTRCDGVCVDTRSSLTHCGACARSCEAGSFCSEGSCTDSCPLTVCGDECADTTSSPVHCGMCGSACGDTGFCDDGACADTCPPPLRRCDGTCIDTGLDPDNCGGCGNVCDADEVCALGRCALECPSGTTNCGGSCVDTDVSITHCGACDVGCAGDEVCRVGGCIPVRDLTDSDGDGIADLDEGATEPGGPVDTDGDGTPDYLDDDSDGDGLPDSREAGDSDPGTPPVDSDRDGTPDFRDFDSDSDGLSDADEAARPCLDPTRPDTDGDGQTDLAEVTAGTDPCDPDSRIPEFFYILPKDDPGGESAATLLFDTNIRRADVHFSMDTTGSMGGEIDNLQASLRSEVIPGIQASIMDTAFGVSEFEDFPISPFGSPTCMGSPDRPFRLFQQVTTDVARVGSAIGMLDMPLGCGADLPESTYEALFQIADGRGVTWPGGGEVPPFSPDGSTPGGGEIGGVGFRSDAFPIVIHITDDVPHQASDYAGAGITGAHSRDDVVDAMSAISARIIGIASRLEARGPLEDLAIASGATVPPNAAGNCETRVDGRERPPVTLPDGSEACPLVFDARSNGSGLSDTLVDAVNALVTAITFDTVSIRVVGDDRGFIRATIPRSAVPPPGADPPTVADLDGDSVFDSFVDVTPGTVVEFTVLAYNDVVPQTDVDQVFTVTLQVVGDGVAVLDEQPVTIIVPRRPVD